MKILIVSPHRDDAAFSAGLALSGWSHAGLSIEVLNCFTRSEYAPYSDADSLHPNDRMSFVTALRKREDECWNKLNDGRFLLTDLRLKDAPIRLRCSLDQISVLPVRSDEKAFAKIVAAVTLAQAAVVLPLGIGSHVDHRTAREAALSALDESRPYALYEDLPYAAFAGASTPQSLVDEIAERRGCLLSPVLVGEERVRKEPDPAQVVDAAIALKRRCALCYDSQINDDLVNEIAEFSRQYGGRERLWVNAAWRQSRPELPGSRL